MYVCIDVHIYKRKQTGGGVAFVSEHDKNNNLGHSVDVKNSGILKLKGSRRVVSRKTKSNLTDCSTVHGVSSSHHVHTRAQGHTCTHTVR